MCGPTEPSALFSYKEQRTTVLGPDRTALVSLGPAVSFSSTSLSWCSEICP